MDASFILLLLLLMCVFIKPSSLDIQTGGVSDDPYEWIRPWFIIDFFRKFWLTR
jgi:hypothetical protein